MANPPITIHIDRVEIHRHDDLLAALATLRSDLMAVAASTQAKLDALTTLITDTGTALSAASDGLAADIADLKAQIASGSSPADIDAALDDLTTKAQALKATSDALAALDATTTPGSIPPPTPPSEPGEPGGGGTQG